MNNKITWRIIVECIGYALYLEMKAKFDKLDVVIDRVKHNPILTAMNPLRIFTQKVYCGVLSCLILVFRFITIK